MRHTRKQEHITLFDAELFEFVTVYQANEHTALILIEPFFCLIDVVIWVRGQTSDLNPAITLLVMCPAQWPTV